MKEIIERRAFPNLSLETEEQVLGLLRLFDPRVMVDRNNLLYGLEPVVYFHKTPGVRELEQAVFACPQFATELSALQQLAAIAVTKAVKEDRAFFSRLVASGRRTPSEAMMDMEGEMVGLLERSTDVGSKKAGMKSLIRLGGILTRRAVVIGGEAGDRTHYDELERYRDDLVWLSRRYQIRQVDGYSLDQLGQLFALRRMPRVALRESAGIIQADGLGRRIVDLGGVALERGKKLGFDSKLTIENPGVKWEVTVNAQQYLEHVAGRAAFQGVPEISIQFEDRMTGKKRAVRLNSSGLVSVGITGDVSEVMGVNEGSLREEASEVVGTTLATVVREGRVHESSTIVFLERMTPATRNWIADFLTEAERVLSNASGINGYLKGGRT